MTKKYAVRLAEAERAMLASGSHSCTDGGSRKLVLRSIGWNLPILARPHGVRLHCTAGPTRMQGLSRTGC
jgi:hypothetical protein